MDLLYSSTRNANNKKTASQAILQGLAEDGGLFVPDRIPRLLIPFEKLPDLSYQEIAYEVMRLYLTDFTEKELKDCISCAYDDKFDTKDIAPLHAAGDLHYLELFHGRTIAFKDMALSILPFLMTTAAKKNKENRRIVILTATSGDTGKAALEGFADVPGTAIIVFYPKDGVSAIQERQMVTQKGENTCVIGIRGNFDDAQRGVKELFADPKINEELMREGYRFSSANSINIGRLVPQIVYYVYAYAGLIKDGSLCAGEPMNVVVPTGNFGNILAAYYAKEMGIPIGKLICASNENKVLYDFFRTGTYDRNREFFLTTSPSMDILISSNLERLIYQSAGKDADKNAALMKELEETGRYEVTKDMRSAMKDFAGGYATQQQCADEIRRIYELYGYVLDPHTAVASYVYHRDFEGSSKDPALIVSTASPYKFARSVLDALGKDTSKEDDFALIDTLHEICGGKIPPAIENIRNAPVLHDLVIEKDAMGSAVKQFLRKDMVK